MTDKRDTPPAETGRCLTTTVNAKDVQMNRLLFVCKHGEFRNPCATCHATYTHPTAEPAETKAGPKKHYCDTCGKERICENSHCDAPYNKTCVLCLNGAEPAAPVSPPDPFSKGYKHRQGEPVSNACGDGRHSECMQDLTKCHCTYRSGHIVMHAYMNPAVVESTDIPEPSLDWDWWFLVAMFESFKEHLAASSPAPQVLKLLQDCLGSLQMESECEGYTIDPCVQCRIKAFIRSAPSPAQPVGSAEKEQK